MKTTASLVLFLFLQALSQTGPDYYNHKKGLALSGYDPVSYFQGNPKEGTEKFSANVNGITYYFASADNQAIFEKDPGKYEPQYGGWCAYAMGDDGSKVDVDPETYKIVNGKLYLFYNKFFTNTLDYCNRDEANLKKKADANWKRYQ